MAALGPNGTLVLPSFTGDDDSPFDSAMTPADPDIGVVPDVFWRLPDVRRSDHPFACAAYGLEAARIVADPIPFPPHKRESPVGRVHELDGKVLLLGVGHGENTTIHFAELEAGVPYRRPKHCTVLKDGEPVRIDYDENDHCCQRFALADDWMRERNLQSEGSVGYGTARLMRSRHLVATVVDRLTEEPLTFLHPRDTGCWECDDAWRSVGSGA